MLTFLFWNLYRKDQKESIRRLARTHQVDIFIFAEYRLPATDDLIIGLNGDGNGLPFRYFPGREPGPVEIISRLAPKTFEPVSEDGRYSIRRLLMTGQDELLLVAVHLRSLLHRNKGEEDQREAARRLAEEIRRVESEVGHSRTILVGDFNLNPFDSPMIAAAGFHGVMSHAKAREESRKVSERYYPFFYNPMWSRIGEHPDRPHGTYYYSGGGQVCYFWNTFDQVLIRPSLLDFWSDQELRVLTDDGEESLITKTGIPNKANYSDHLPILFRLNLPNWDMNKDRTDNG
jgi:hypothetical protein